MNIERSLMTGSTTLLVLSLLREGEKYGYEMIQELALRSDDTFKLKEGTLYPILHTLEKGKYIKSRAVTAPSGRERKYYRITKDGLALLEEKTAEWEHFTEKVNGVIYGGARSLA